MYLVMTDHVGNNCPLHYQYKKFRQCSLYRTLDICAFPIISQSKQTCKWAIYMNIQWRHNIWLMPLPTTTSIPSMAWKNVNFPESKPPNSLTVYMFSRKKGTISLQISTFHARSFPNSPRFPTVIPSFMKSSH